MRGLVVTVQAAVLDPAAPTGIGGLSNGGVLRLH
jgi:hypothetical protein